MKTDEEIKDITIAQLKHTIQSMRNKETIKTQAIKELNSEITRLREANRSLISIIIYIIKNILHGSPLVVTDDEFDGIYNNAEEGLLFEENSAGDCIVKIPCKTSRRKAS